MLRINLLNPRKGIMMYPSLNVADVIVSDLNYTNMSVIIIKHGYVGDGYYYRKVFPTRFQRG